MSVQSPRSGFQSRAIVPRILIIPTEPGDRKAAEHGNLASNTLLGHYQQNTTQQRE